MLALIPEEQANQRLAELICGVRHPTAESGEIVSKSAVKKDPDSR